MQCGLVGLSILFFQDETQIRNKNVALGVTHTASGLVLRGGAASHTEMPGASNTTEPQQKANLE